MELLILAVYLAIVSAVIGLLWRIASALDATSRHLLEIARDVKRLARSAKDGEEDGDDVDLTG